MINISSTELILYSVQQNINRILINNINHITIANTCIIFAGGLLTSVNPCMLSSVPVSIMYIDKQKNRLIGGIVFIAGIITSIMLIGISVITFKQSHFYALSSIPLVWSLMIIAVGLNLLGIIEIIIPLPRASRKMKQVVQPLTEIYLLGCSTGISASPCSTPILITLLAWISSSQQFITGYYFLTVYIAGYIGPLIFGLQALKKLRDGKIFNELWVQFMPASGCSAIGLGIFSLFHELFLYL